MSSPPRPPLPPKPVKPPRSPIPSVSELNSNIEAVTISSPPTTSPADIRPHSVAAIPPPPRPPPPPPKARPVSDITNSSSPPPAPPAPPASALSGNASSPQPPVSKPPTVPAPPAPAQTPAPPSPPKVDSEDEAEQASKGSSAPKQGRVNSIFRSSILIDRRRSVKMKSGDEVECILTGVLSKRNREGNFDPCIFTLTKDALLYQKVNASNNGIQEDTVIQENECKNIPINAVLVCPLKDSDYANSEKRNRAFRLMTKSKSFLVRAKTEEMKNDWFQAISTTALQARVNNNFPSLSEADMAPIWDVDDTKCQLCQKAFGIFFRKHHCRNCGITVCEPCSKEKCRIPRLDEKALFKVCNRCARELKEHRTYGFQVEENA